MPNLSPVPDNTTREAFLATTKVKHSGVHIGDGIFLSANHYPKPFGKSTAVISQGLDHPYDRLNTTERDYTLPRDLREWDAALDSSNYIGIHRDSAIHYTELPKGYEDLPTAQLLITLAPDELNSEILLLGYPKQAPGSPDAIPSSHRDLYVANGHYSGSGHASKLDSVLHYDHAGISAHPGMSGGPVYINLDPDGDGLYADYLVAEIATTSGGPLMTALYPSLCENIIDIGKTADSLERVTFLGSATEGQTYTGCLLHEDMYGGAGNDIFRPGAGNDLIRTGEGRDRIELQSGDGRDQITDFAPLHDQLVINGALITNYQTLTLDEGPLGVDIHYGEGDALLLLGITLAMLLG